jgi:hypothetical protein
MGIAAGIRQWWKFQRVAAIRGAPEWQASARAPVGDGRCPGGDVDLEGQELPHLLQAVGLDVHELGRTAPGLMQEMHAACSTCRFADRCFADLCRGTAASRYILYCPNADRIDALVAGRGADAACA